jgi:hypothetical protein
VLAGASVQHLPVDDHQASDGRVTPTLTASPPSCSASRLRSADGRGVLEAVFGTDVEPQFAAPAALQ